MVDQGSFTLTEQDINLLIDRVLTSSLGTFVLSGQSVLLRQGYTFSLDQGSFTLTGQEISTLVGRLISGDYGIYTLSGQNVGFNYSGTDAKIIVNLNSRDVSITLKAIDRNITLN